jgi:hypothetical protein
VNPKEAGFIPGTSEVLGGLGAKLVAGSPVVGAISGGIAGNLAMGLPALAERLASLLGTSPATAASLLAAGGPPLAALLSGIAGSGAYRALPPGAQKAVSQFGRTQFPTFTRWLTRGMNLPPKLSAYELGFLTKCAEAGLDEETACKLAQFGIEQVPGSPLSNSVGRAGGQPELVPGNPASAPKAGKLGTLFKAPPVGGAGAVPSIGQNAGGSTVESPINAQVTAKKPVGT